MAQGVGRAGLVGDWRAGQVGRRRRGWLGGAGEAQQLAARPVDAGPETIGRSIHHAITRPSAKLLTTAVSPLAAAWLRCGSSAAPCPCTHGETRQKV